MASVAAKDFLPAEVAVADLPLAYEISNRSASQWKPKVRDPRKQDKVINSSKIMMLSVRSRWNAGGRRGNVDIQYVPGAPTIFINDYVDVDGNVQPGLRKLYPGDELKKDAYLSGIKAGICFVDGYLFLENFGGKDNRLLLEFVHHHALNEGSPNFKRTRDLNSQLLFKPFLPEKKAEITLQSLDKEEEASHLFYGIRDKKGNYDVPKLNALLGIFDLGGGLGADDNAQKMVLLAPRFKSSPLRFIKDYEEATEEYIKAIGVAQNLGVLALTSKDAKMKIGAELHSLMTFNTSKEDERVQALVFHFLGTEKGKHDYTLLCGEVEIKKIEVVGKK
jgi:hypothetical protein